MMVASSRDSAAAADVVLHIDAAEAQRRGLAQLGTGNVEFSSQSRACGAMSSRANCRAVAWKARWSSVSSKSTGYFFGRNSSV